MTMATEAPLVTLRRLRPAAAAVRIDRGVELDDDVSALIAANGPVAIGVSGG